jgi:hypothetical protein
MARRCDPSAQSSHNRLARPRGKLAARLQRKTRLRLRECSCKARSVVRRERISGHFMADRPHVIVQRLCGKQRRGRNIGARLCPADWGKPMTKCGVRLKCKVLRARSIECALSVRNEPRQSCSPSKLLPNQIGGSLRPLTAGSPMQGTMTRRIYTYPLVNVSAVQARAARLDPPK